MVNRGCLTQRSVCGQQGVPDPEVSALSMSLCVCPMVVSSSICSTILWVWGHNKLFGKTVLTQPSVTLFFYLTSNLY